MANKCNPVNNKIQAIRDLSKSLLAKDPRFNELSAQGKPITDYLISRIIDINNIIREEAIAANEEVIPLEITRDEILNAIALGDKAHISSISDEIQDAAELLRLMRSQRGKAKMIEKMIEQHLKNPNKKTPNTAALSAMSNVIKDMRAIAALDEVNLATPEDYAQLINDLETIPHLVDGAFQLDVTRNVKESHLKEALKALRNSQKALKLVNLEKSIAEQKAKIENLKSKNPDMRYLKRINSGDFISSIHKDLLTEEGKLTQAYKDAKKLSSDISRLAHDQENLKAEVEARRRDIERERRVASGIKLLGNTYTNPPALYLKNFLILAKEEGWESMRSLQFMLDASYMFVQLAPVVIPTLMGTNIQLSALVKGDFSGAFVYHRMLGKAFWEGTFKVMADAGKHIRQGGSTKHFTSRNADKQYDYILANDYYPLSQKAGLKISRRKSLTDSEEFFRTNLLNKIGVVGLVKDISEEMMVTTLNSVRMNLFELLVSKNPEMTLDETIKVAEVVNNLTGTTRDAGDITNSLSYLMSAPRLLVSRLKLAAAPAKMLYQNSDIGDTVRNKQIARMFAGYGALMTVAAILGIDICLDPAESCFLRLGIGDTRVDPTGGMGALARLGAGLYTLANDPPEWSSETAKEKWKYLKDVKKENAKGLLIRNLFEYKMHPALSASFQAYTGRDFFGRPFEDSAIPFVDKPMLGPIESRVEAAFRNIMPISLVTYQEIVDKYNFGYNAEPGAISVQSAILTTTLQFLGANAYVYSNKMQTPNVREYLSEIPRPNPRYPDWIKEVENKKTQEFLKIQFRNMWSDEVGMIIEEHDFDPAKLDKNKLSREINKVSKGLEDDFNRQYKEGYQGEVAPDDSRRGRRVRMTRSQ